MPKKNTAKKQNQRDEEKSPLLTQEALPLYITKHILGEKKDKRTRIIKGVKITAGIVGALWGVPWIKSSQNAAVIFPTGIIREVFEKIFSAGIVMTVGIDGSWVMSASTDRLVPASKEEQRLIKGTSYNTCPTKIREIILPAIFSLLSCAAPVYAAFKYNDGWQKYFALIILVINFGYGFFGYSKFLDTIFQKIREQFVRPELLAIKNELVEKARYLSCVKPISLGGIDTADQLIETIYGVDLQKKQITCLNKSGKVIQYSIAFLLPIGSCVVDVLLTKEFLKTTIYNNTIFDYSAAIFCEIPNYTIGILSVYILFGKVFDFLACGSRQMRNSKNLFTSCILPGTIFTLALTAPTAASYITYTTVASEAGSFWATLATVLIGLQRFIFSNFTLNNIANTIIASITSFFHKENDPAKISSAKLNELSEVLSKTQPEHFKYVVDGPLPLCSFFSRKNPLSVQPNNPIPQTSINTV